jgi:Kef-type K+ transport system membrane component KefB
MHSISFLMALALVLCVVRGLSLVVRKGKQPVVVAEMAAGILLGPAVLGALWPEAFGSLFPNGTLHVLNSFGECGVILFVFLVGTEIGEHLPNVAGIRPAAMRVGAWAFAVPLALGLALAPLLFVYAPAGVGFWRFASFVSLALATTAVPVMAYILKERNEVRSAAGTLALSAAVLTDVVIWICLPLLMGASRGGTDASALAASVGTVSGMALFAYAILRPALAAYCSRVRWSDDMSALPIGVLITGAILCASITNALGFHSVFGAILFGLSVPRDAHIRRQLDKVLMPVTGAVLLPCFLVSAGLGISSSLLQGIPILLLLLVIAAGILGKVGGGAIGARLAGRDWRSAVAVGALMNTRGMMEVVILKIGMDAGLVGQEIFTLFLIMAVVTTAMTVPSMNLIARHARQPARAGVAEAGHG